MLEKATGWIRSLTEAGLALIALGVVLQIIFGAAVPFIGIDVIGSVVGLVKQLGGEGLVGLVSNMGTLGNLFQEVIIYHLTKGD